MELKMDPALKKLFAKIDELTQKLAKVDELSARLDRLDTNGALDNLSKELAKVVANSSVVLNTIKDHGSAIARIGQITERIFLQCPIASIDTSETDEVALKDIVCTDNDE